MSNSTWEVGKYYRTEVTNKDIMQGDACSHTTCPGYLAILRDLRKRYGRQNFKLSVRPHTIKFTIPTLKITIIMQPQSTDGSKISRLDELYKALQKTKLHSKRECQAMAKKAMKPFTLRARIESVKKIRGWEKMTEEAKKQLAANRKLREEMGLKNTRLNIGRSLSP